MAWEESHRQNCMILPETKQRKIVLKNTIWVLQVEFKIDKKTFKRTEMSEC